MYMKKMARSYWLYAAALLLASPAMQAHAQNKKATPSSTVRLQTTPLAAPDSTVEVMPSTIGPYCPKKLLGGDREFGGHGPEIWAWIRLKIVDKKHIDATVYMHARETTHDWSETEGTWTKRIYTAPAGYEIRQILSGQYSEVHYVSKPGVNAFSPQGLVQALGGGARGAEVPFKDDGLVRRWHIVGDTGGDDISDDDNCHDDTQVAVQLNTMKLRLVRVSTTKPKTVVVTPPPARRN